MFADLRPPPPQLERVDSAVSNSPAAAPPPHAARPSLSATAPLQERAAQALLQACAASKVCLEWAWDKALELIELAKSKAQADPRPYHQRTPLRSDVEF